MLNVCSVTKELSALTTLSQPELLPAACQHSRASSFGPQAQQQKLLTLAGHRQGVRYYPAGPHMYTHKTLGEEVLVEGGIHVTG